MRSKVNVDSDIGRLVLEGMMTIFIVLIFLFIARNWVLTNADETLFATTCNLSDGGVGIDRSGSYETNKIIDNYKLCKIRFDNM